MKDASISVVIPAYNAENCIIRALDSVYRQSRFALIREIIVVNDGSKDNTADIVRDYAERRNDGCIKLINQANKGVSGARNAGIKYATGEWIALLDSDDEWTEDKLELQEDVIDSTGDVDFLGGNINDGTLKVLGKKIDKLHKASIKEICIKMFPQTSTALFKKEILNTVGYYDENQKYAEDGNLFQRICVHYNYYHLPKKLVIYDGGKIGFGKSGLSANLPRMYEGNVKNIRELRREKNISFPFYVFLRLFYWLKYIRRIIHTSLRSNA